MPTSSARNRPVASTRRITAKPAGSYASGSAAFITTSHNRKLSPNTLEPTAGRPRPVAHAPFASATYASIAKTCVDECPFKKSGCYVRSGATKLLSSRLDFAAHDRTGDEVIAYEAMLIDRAFPKGVPQDGARGGRDLRLHVGGDIKTKRHAARLGGAATNWLARGGGRVWTFTHAWHRVPRDAWGGSVSVLASVERPEDIEAAREAGYAAAIVVPAFPSTKAFFLPGATARIVPCPAETSDRTCVECRLCLDADRLHATNTAIAFAAHGPNAAKARDALVQLRRGKDQIVGSV